MGLIMLENFSLQMNGILHPNAGLLLVIKGILFINFYFKGYQTVSNVCQQNRLRDS